MRFTVIAAFGILGTLAVFPVNAAVPNSVTALLGPSIGYLLAQSDLCHWELTERIQTTYRNGFKEMGMTAAQQTAVWDQATARQRDLGNLPAEAKARMKADT